MDKNKMPTAYHGVKDVVVSKKDSGTYAAPIPIDFAKSLSYQKQQNESTKVYANNIQIDEIPNGGYADGAIGCTANSVPLETAIGVSIDTSIGTVEVIEDALVRAAIGYAVTVRDPETKKPADVKVWILNATISTTGQETHETDNESKTIGAITYDYRAYGEEATIKAEKKTIIRVKSFPGDTNYENFLKTVPDLETITAKPTE